MIVAYNKDHKKIRASESLPHVSEGGVYQCTYKWCPHPDMILRKGKHVIPHFAHKEGGGCDELSEADAERHLQIKDFFQELLKVDLDAIDYGDIEGVRPDILYQKKYAIELQCSPISDDEIRRRNAIYVKNGFTPVWIFDEKEFLPEPNRYHEYRLRFSERFVHTVQRFMLYFAIDEETLTPSGFPTVTWRSIEFSNPTEGCTKFHINKAEAIVDTIKANEYFAMIASQWNSFQKEVMGQSDYRDIDLYQQDLTNKWAIWKKSVVCVAIKPGFGQCNKRFYVDPDSDQTKCDPCIDAEILAFWDDIKIGMEVTNVDITRRTLKIEGKVTLPEHFVMDARNAGQIFYHLATIDQMKTVFNFEEGRYHDLRMNYENQLNRVYSNIEKVSDNEFTFRVNTLLRERKTKAHATVPSV